MAAIAEGKAKRSIAKMATDLVSAQKLRKSLRRPSGFKFAIADGVALLNGEQWDRVVGQSTFFLDRGYLSMLEQAGPESHRPGTAWQAPA
jgi:hypothetical protein